jgi:hypothetical protein
MATTIGQEGLMLNIKIVLIEVDSCLKLFASVIVIYEEN